MLLTLHVVMQAITLPFLDMTLIACNCATATIVNMVLSTQILKEKFIWKYDLTAMSLIALGCVMIAVNANTDQVSYNGEQIAELILSPSTIIFGSVGLVMLLCESCMLSSFLDRVRTFEQEALAYEDSLRTQGSL